MVRHLFLAAALLFVMAQADAQSAGWIELGNSGSGRGLSDAGFAFRQDVAVAADGTPTVAWFKSHGIDSYSGEVARWNGSTWENLPPFDSDVLISVSLSLVLNASGHPVVAWTSGSRLYCSAWNGSSWNGFGPSASGQGIPGFTDMRDEARLALDSAGRPTVACVTWAGTGEIRVTRWDGTAWNFIGGAANGSMPLVIADGSFSLGFTLDATSNPVVAWEGTGAHLARWNGNAWVPLGESLSPGGIDGSSPGATGVSVALAGGRLVITWTRGESTTANVFVKEWNGSAWVGLAGSGSGTGIATLSLLGTPPYTYFPVPSLAGAANGTVTVAWQAGPAEGGTQIYVLQWDGSVWGPLGTSNSGAGISNQGGSFSPVVAVDPLGNPSVVWNSTTSPMSTCVYLRRWAGAVPTPTPSPSPSPKPRSGGSCGAMAHPAFPITAVILMGLLATRALQRS